MPETLTACVIVRDEEQRLPECLASLEFCDQIVVVDGGSSDRTVELARAAGAQVVENPWPGFAAQRNVALDRSSGTWALEIDADERVSPELAREIRVLLESPPSGLTMAAIPLRDVFLGRPLGPSTRYPRYRYRLFRRGAFRHDESRRVHEGLWPSESITPLRGDLIHVLAESWSEALRDAWIYARLDGRQRSRPDLAEAVFGIAVRPVAKFGYRTVLYGAWRDGWRGVARVFLECSSDALTTLFRLRAGTDLSELTGLAQEPPREGPVRIVGLALKPPGATRLERWLSAAAIAGADVALICPTIDEADPSVARRILSGSGVGELLQALDAENQVRPIDALALDGWRERLLLNVAPRALRGAVSPLDAGGDAAAAERWVRAATRVAAPTTCAATLVKE